MMNFLMRETANGATYLQVLIISTVLFATLLMWADMIIEGLGGDKFE